MNQKYESWDAEIVRVAGRHKRDTSRKPCRSLAVVDGWACDRLVPTGFRARNTPETWLP